MFEPLNLIYVSHGNMDSQEYYGMGSFSTFGAEYKGAKELHI